MRAYESGVTVSELARSYRVHHSTVSDHLNRSAMARRTPALDEGQVKQATQLYAAGLSFRAIGRQLGVHAGTVRRYLFHAGIKPSPMVESEAAGGCHLGMARDHAGERA